ncbi:MoaD/ThiS family protein [Arenicellales bacterium nBUS_48]
MTPVRIGIRVTGHLIDFCSVDALELPDGASISDAIFLLGIPVEQVGLVSIDGQAVSKAKRDDFRLVEGNEMVVMAPLTGG